MNDQFLGLAPATYTALKDFAGPIATLFAAIAAAVITFYFNRSQNRIAQSQRDIALDKLKFDLLEKLYDIYLAAKALIQHVWGARDKAQWDVKKVGDLEVKLDEGRFYFPDHIQQFLKDVRAVVGQKAVHLVERSEVSEAAHFAPNRKTLDADDERLAAFYGKMPETFETVLGFKQLTQDRGEARR
jgi:hypothetical protein